jgi:acetoin utilization deacetylase AcuC-like enzyme
VRRGRDGDEVPGGVDVHLGQSCGDVWKPIRVDPAHVEVHGPLAAPRELGLYGERDLVPRRELVDEALAPSVEKRRSLAANGLGYQEAVAWSVVAQRGGMELHELEVGEIGARAVGEREPGADGASRVCRALPERGHAAGGEDHRARKHRDGVPTSRPRGEPNAASVVRGQRRRGERLEDVDPLVGGRQGGEVAGDASARGCATGVDHAAAGVSPFEAQREIAGAVRIEAHAELLELTHARRRLLAEHPRGAGASRIPAGRQRVAVMALGRVVGGERGGYPTLSPVASGLRQRRSTDQRHPRTGAGGDERGIEAGGAGADHGDVRAKGLFGNGAGTVPARMPVYLRHSSSLEHHTGFGHPERAERIRALEAELERRHWLGWERREAPRASEEQLLAVHTPEHLRAVRELSAREGAFDLDTPLSEGSWEAALHAAGGACALVDTLLSEGERTGFAALRPPGHHAERARAMGFCLFSNVAVAARHALDSLGADRVFVLDWDVHHGNGTNAIFHESPEVLFVSIHQYPFYPGTGPLADVGSGPGEGFSLNLPVPGGSGEDVFLSLVEHIAVPAARQFRPHLILISAGFDAHRADPVGGCALETSSYGELARRARALADELSVPVGAVLEGGYDVDALAGSVAATMQALADGGAPRSTDRHRLAEAAAETLGRYWEL